MFFRTKVSGAHTYLQIAESFRESGKVRQRVIATLGRLDELQKSGHLEALLKSGSRFAAQSMVLTAYREGEGVTARGRRIGPALVFERLWRETGCAEVIGGLLAERQFAFAVERAVVLTVLHRLWVSGSDRSAERWRRDYAIAGTEKLELHHLYRAMAWLGEELPAAEKAIAGLPPRCVKDQIEEGLFARNRDLFTELELVFFDTTSIYFEGAGGETLGQRGHSKDHRPDRPQIVVGAALDQAGRPLGCELWPGNQADVTTLIPMARRLRQRFGVQKACLVADRGMISAETLATLEQEGWEYILGARMRAQSEVRDEVLSRAGRYHRVSPEPRDSSRDPLEVKEVWVEKRRYIVCRNAAQARKDAADRAAILEALGEGLKRGDKALIGNRGYRRYVQVQGEGFVIDERKIEEEARYDGKWVLRTNTTLSAEEVALKYKQLWMVEQLFRSAKSLLETRPIFHHCDATIRGHVFCSFLALLLRKALQDRLEQSKLDLEWLDILRDLDALEEIEIVQGDKRFLLRTQALGCCSQVFKAVGVRLPATIRTIG